MTFDGVDIKLDAVLHSTNLISHGRQAMNDQETSEFNKNCAVGPNIFGGNVLQASASTNEVINSRHRTAHVPVHDEFEHGLRTAVNINAAAQDEAVVAMSQPASGIGQLINPGF